MPMDDHDGVIWLDGEFVPWREARIHVLTHTLHYGMGAFEGVRAYETGSRTAIFRLQDHTERLFRSLHILRMNMPWDRDAINQACIEVLRKNNLKSAYLRPMCFYGSEGMGLRADNLKVHAMVAAWPWGTPTRPSGSRCGASGQPSSSTITTWSNPSSRPPRTPTTGTTRCACFSGAASRQICTPGCRPASRYA